MSNATSQHPDQNIGVPAVTPVGQAKDTFWVPCVRACAKSLSGVLWVCTQYSMTVTTHEPLHTLLCQSPPPLSFFPLCPLVLGVELGKHCTTELCLQPAWPNLNQKQIKNKNKYHCPSVANPWVSVILSI